MERLKFNFNNSYLNDLANNILVGAAKIQTYCDSLEKAEDNYNIDLQAVRKTIEDLFDQLNKIMKAIGESDNRCLEMSQLVSSCSISFVKNLVQITIAFMDLSGAKTKNDFRIYAINSFNEAKILLKIISQMKMTSLNQELYYNTILKTEFLNQLLGSRYIEKNRAKVIKLQIKEISENNDSFSGIDKKTFKYIFIVRIQKHAFVAFDFCCIMNFHSNIFNKIDLKVMIERIDKDLFFNLKRFDPDQYDIIDLENGSQLMVYLHRGLSKIAYGGFE